MVVSLTPVKYYGSSFDKLLLFRRKNLSYSGINDSSTKVAAGLGRQGLRLPPSAFLSLTLGFGSGFACLGYAVLLAFARRFYAYGYEKKSGIFGEKERSGERTFSPKMAYLVFVPPPLHKNMICKKVLYITRSYGTFLIPPHLAPGNVP